MDRTSDFVRLDDVLDPDRTTVRPSELCYAGSGNRHAGAVVTLVCFAGLAALAVFQPHARNFTVSAPAISEVHR
jgi:hypothetical protein